MIPHVIIPNAMGEAFADRLHALAVARQETAEAGRVRDMSTPSGRIDTTLRNVLVIRDLGELADELERGVDAHLDSVHARLGVGPFVAGRKQFSLVAYGDGAFYRRHLDTTINPRPGQATRQITFVYYFHREPRVFTGGVLRLYDFAGRGSLDLEPQRDTFAAFPSWIAHEVLPVACGSPDFADSRFAINIWVTGSASGSATP